LPQAPQLSESAPTSTQAPPHRVELDGHCETHVPPEQAMSLEQAFPQLPQ
jgi:hypothetical protein